MAAAPAGASLCIKESKESLCPLKHALAACAGTGVRGRLSSMEASGASHLLALSIDAYRSRPSNQSLAFTGVCALVLLCAVESSFYAFTCWRARVSPGPILGHPRHRRMLSRRAFEVLMMASFTVQGLWAHDALGGFSGYASAYGGDPVRRMLAYEPFALRLALSQLVYQAYNTYISARDGDGPIFLAHHVATGLLCFLALHPFVLSYAPFFLGLSELSSALLCALATTDEAHGVPELANVFPVTQKVLGVVFALTFTVFRIVLWPYVSYLFWHDTLAVLAAGAHPAWVCYTFLVFNAGLSGLQVLWFGEILREAFKLFAPKRSKGSSD